MIVITSNKFDKQFKKQHQKIKDEFGIRVKMLMDDVNNQILKAHKLSGKLKGLWSFNVSADIRVIFDRNQKGVILLVAIGSHSEPYE
jgi:addiction module RelE/StbE family toxin